MTSTKSSLRGKKVAVLAADGFEWIELIVPMKALQRAGATIEVISLHREKVRGVNLTAPTRTVRVDTTIEEVNPHAYDALLIPGGFVNPDLLRSARGGIHRPRTRRESEHRRQSHPRESPQRAQHPELLVFKRGRGVDRMIGVYSKSEIGRGWSGPSPDGPRAAPGSALAADSPSPVASRLRWLPACGRK